MLAIDAILAFGAAASTRMFPFYSDFSEQNHWGDSSALRSALDFAWQCAEGREVTRDEIERHGALADMVARIEPRHGYGWEFTCSHYAALSVASCIDFALSHQPKDSVAAAEWVFNAAYQAAGYSLFKSIGRMKSTPTSRQQTLEHPLVQTELIRQRRDLDQLCEAADLVRPATIRVLHDRSLEEETLPQT